MLVLSSLLVVYNGFMIHTVVFPFICFRNLRHQITKWHLFFLCQNTNKCFISRKWNHNKTYQYLKIDCSTLIFFLLRLPSYKAWKSVKNLCLGGGNSNIFYFHPENWGRWTHFDEHIFQMGWFNHQLENLCQLWIRMAKNKDSLTLAPPAIQTLFLWTRDACDRSDGFLGMCFLCLCVCVSSDSNQLINGYKIFQYLVILFQMQLISANGKKLVNLERLVVWIP